MSEVESDHEPNKSAGGEDLTTDGAISLFTSALNNALDRQKATLIEHFEKNFPKTDKASGVGSSEFTFKKEGHKVQHSFNSELQKVCHVWKVC